MAHFTARVSRTDPCAIRITGEVDLAAEPELRELIDSVAQECEAIRLDMRAVTFCDSTGVHLILHAYRIGRRVIVRPSSAVLRVLELAGVDELVVIDGA